MNLKNMVLVLVASLLGALVVIGGEVSAISSDEIYNRILMNDLYNCYNNPYMNMSVTPSDFKGKNFNNFFKENVLKSSNATTQKWRLPTQMGSDNNTNGNLLSCQDLFLSGHGFGGVFAHAGIDLPAQTDSASAPDFLKNIGYSNVANNTSGGLACIRGNYSGASTIGNDGDLVGEICFNKDIFGSEGVDGYILTQNPPRIKSDDAFGMSVGYNSSVGPGLEQGLYIRFSHGNDGCNTTKTITGSGADGKYTYEDLSKLGNLECPLDVRDKVYRMTTSYYVDSEGKALATYSMPGYTAAFNQVGNFLSSSRNTFSDDDKYDLYMWYLSNVYGANAADNTDCQNDRPANVTSGDKLYVHTSDGWCRLSYSAGEKDTKVAAFTASERYLLNTEYTIKQLVGAMANLNVSGSRLIKLGNIGNTGEDGDGGETTVKENCTSSGAGESIGWILCPILTFLSNAADNAYSNYVEPALQVDPVLFQERSGNKNDARDAWGVFQGIANTLFIILLIVVIFSQLTGVGIDNYGIKKILPKLIVAAVLINLSYLICIICVDLSNILGNAFQALFNGLSESFRNNIPSDLGINSLGDVASSIRTTAITGLVILAILAAEIWPVVQDGGGPAVLLALLGAALSVAVAIFFLFLLLAVREAAIVVLTVISPVAFACFILPNTKKLFDRWLKFGWQLLLVYPICGLLVGGGNFVSALTLSVGAGQGGFFAAFMAIVVGVVPIFFIPSVLRSSFAAAGNIGAKLSGVGQRLGRRMSGNLDKVGKGSNMYKSASARSMERRNLRMAGLRRDENGNLVERERSKSRALNAIRRATHGGNRGEAIARAQVLADEKRRGEEERLMGGGFMAGIAGINAKAEDAVVSDRLSLMQSRGINIGGEEPGAYTLDNMIKRMKQLEEYSRENKLSDDEKLEMAALARGMMGEKGGAGKLASIVRENGVDEVTDKDGKKTKVRNGLNSEFMNAMGDIYGKDSAVRSKMREKDAGASIYTEQFMQGGGGAGNADFDSYHDTKEYAEAINNRVKSHAAGLGQSGAGLREYLGRLDNKNESNEYQDIEATRRAYQDIVDDDALMNSLDAGDREEVWKRAREVGVTGKRVQNVNVVGGSNGGVPAGGAPAGGDSDNEFTVPRDTQRTVQNYNRSQAENMRENWRSGQGLPTNTPENGGS